ncbi:MAG: preprotein translocase subunit SecE [Gemmatimonadota bacterium]
MTTQNVETINSKADFALVSVAIVIVLAGVLGFSFLSDQSMLARIGILVGGIVIGLGVAWFSHPGKRFIGFARESYDEARRVTWPSRKETVNTTGIVFAFVVVMAIFLFIVDKSLEWLLYDLLLHWK